MAILSLGVSFRRAPLELLERLAFSNEDLAKAYRRAADDPAIDEAVVLSTCNRVEVYASVPAYHAGFMALKRLLAETREVDPQEFAEPLYAHYEADAADHLFAVAAGLDSMVLGETQIHAQVREAIRSAVEEDAAGPGLAALFHAAGRAGRRVRAETSLGRAPDALVALGADMASEAAGGLEDRRVVVIGAGQMAALAAKLLRARGVGDMVIVNRSLPHAGALASRTGARAAGLEELGEAVAAADLVVSATGAAGTVIPPDVVRGQTVLLDLAVPRDVDPAVAELEGVTLIDVIALRAKIAETDEGTAEDIARAHEIVADEVRRFVVRRRSGRLAPLISELRRHGEEVVDAELRRNAARLSDLTPDERAAVEALARGIAAKLLHDPIVALKERSEPGTEGVHARVLAELLGLDPDAVE
jgi:glutamyl-tRNA reductase